MTEAKAQKPVSRFRQKQAEFIRKHGFSLKSYAIAFVALPPAAIFIALKMAQYAFPVRIVAALLVLVVHGALLLGGGALVMEVIDRWRN